MTKTMVTGHREKGGRIVIIVDDEPQADKDYTRFAGQFGETARLIMQNNYADGKDDIETPDDLVHGLLLLKGVTSDILQEKGQAVLYDYMGRAHKEFFATNEMKKLDQAHKNRLEEVLRWHLQDAITNPPPLVKRK